MPKQLRKEAQRTYSDDQLASEQSQAQKAPSGTGSETTATTAQLMDEIDAVLEGTLAVSGETAQEFVDRFRQKSGQ